MNICAVILIGGSGAKLWPLSRAVRPKQFFALHGDDTIPQSVVKRLEELSVELTITIYRDIDGRS